MTNPYQEYLDEVEAYATSDAADEPWGIVHLNGKPVPVKDFVAYSNLATFQPKFTVGETSKDSDSTFSVWIQTDWTGGGQMAILNSLSDIQRFRHATAETRYPYMLTLPLYTYDYTVADGGQAYPLGDYKPTATTLFWAAFNTNLCYWDKVAQSFQPSGTLTAAPVNKACVYNGELWIPQGTSGYDRWDGTTITHSTEVQAVSFLIWDDKLMGLGADGQVATFDSIAGSWDIRPELKLKGNETPRNLVNWWDQGGDPTVYVVTDGQVWAVDPLVPTLYKAGLNFPRHPDQGLGSCSWRDDAMYVSVGTGVHQLARGNVVSAMGLDHNDGLPINLRGTIVDLEPEYNGMMALVRGAATVSTSDEAQLGPNLNEPRIFDDAMVVPAASSQAMSTLQRWTGTGWHTVWQSVGATGDPTRVMVSQADGEYRLWWGYGDSMLTQPLRRTFYNPRDGAQLGVDTFASSAFLRTGRFDAGMASFIKAASQLEVEFDPLSNGNLRVRYQTDRNYPNWDLLGTINSSRTLFFDPNDDRFAEGIPFKWIEFEYTLSTLDNSKTPIIMWFTLKFVKVPLMQRAWSFTVPLEFPEQWMGRGAREIADDLDAMASGNEFITFKHRDRAYRVRVAQVQGHDFPGKDLRGMRQVNLIELGDVDTGGIPVITA